MIENNDGENRHDEHSGQCGDRRPSCDDTSDLTGLHVPEPKPKVCNARVMVKAYNEVELTATQRDRLIVKMRRHGYTYRQIGAAVGMTANGVMTSLQRIAEGRPGRNPRA